MTTTITDAWQEFEALHGDAHPIRTLDELRDLIHETAGRYEDVDDRFWSAALGPEGTPDEGWAFNLDVSLGAAVARYEAITIDRDNE